SPRLPASSWARPISHLCRLSRYSVFPMAATSPETAVRNYLTFLSDPDSLRDPEEVKKLEAEVADATDVVDQLMARAALRRAMAIDPGVYEQAFIEHGKEWAD